LPDRLTVAPALPPDWPVLNALVAESVREGYRFLARLKADYDDRTQSFEHPSETLLGVYGSGELLGIGALTRDPFADEEGVGRIRRVYIRERARRRGAARLLVRSLLGAAAPHFHTVTLRSVTEDASRLYESLAFDRVIDYPNVTHVWMPPPAGPHP
jgi:GNAT superfamily N-acetyltransferase